MSKIYSRKITAFLYENHFEMIFVNEKVYSKVYQKILTFSDSVYRIEESLYENFWHSEIEFR